jgi:hypothetical protein
VTDLSSIELPYPLAGRPPVANPAGREYGGGVVGKTNRQKKGAADGVVGMLLLMRYNEGKNCRKKPSSEPKKNGGKAQENNYRLDYKNKPGLLTLLPGPLNWRWPWCVI